VDQLGKRHFRIDLDRLKNTDFHWRGYQYRIWIEGMVDNFIRHYVKKIPFNYTSIRTQIDKYQSIVNDPHHCALSYRLTINRGSGQQQTGHI
jgi:hypothetical protein